MRQPFVLRPLNGVFARAILAVASAFAVASCAPSNQELDRVRVQIPWAESNGVYSLQVIELKTLHKLSSFDGEAAKIRVDPFTTSGDQNSLTPHFRFLRTKDGVLIPTNLESLQMATAYAHMERLMEFDRSAGSYGLLSWPRSIGILKEQSKTVSGGRIANNAYYYSPKDTIILAPYEKNELPMSLNGGIIAHEHFHAIFQHLILSDLKWESKGLLEMNLDEIDHKVQRPDVEIPDSVAPADALPSDYVFLPPPAAPPPAAPGTTENNADSEKPKKEVTEAEISNLTNIVVVRGVNEGLADVWGWLYSGDENFIEPSLKDLSKERTLSSSSKVLSNGFLPTDQHLRNQVVSAAAKGEINNVALSYAVGTYFSRMMRNLFLATRTSQKGFKLSEEPEGSSALERREWAQLLIKMLPKIGESIQKKVLKNEVLSVNFLSEAVESAFPKTNKMCETFRYFWVYEPFEKDRERLCEQDPQ